MNTICQLIRILSVLIVVVFYATISLAQSDNISIKRIIGDYYDITISGERNGDYAKVNRLVVDLSKPMTESFGVNPITNIYALVESGGDVSKKSTYSVTFQETIEPGWNIYYYVADNWNDYLKFLCIDKIPTKSIEISSTIDHEGYLFDLDLTGSTFEPQPEGAFKIRNLKVEGYEERPIWATFKWNPASLKFDFIQASTED